MFGPDPSFTQDKPPDQLALSRFEPPLHLPHQCACWHKVVTPPAPGVKRNEWRPGAQILHSSGERVESFKVQESKKKTRKNINAEDAEGTERKEADSRQLTGTLVVFSAACSYRPGGGEWREKNKEKRFNAEDTERKEADSRQLTVNRQSSRTGQAEGGEL